MLLVAEGSFHSVTYVTINLPGVSHMMTSPCNIFIDFFIFFSQARKRQREEAESGGREAGASVISVDIIGGGASASASSSSASRTELINERIGYKPHPKPATLPTLFGSLQF